MKKTITVFFLLFTISAAAAFRPLSIHHDVDDHVSNDVVLTTKSSSDRLPNDGQITYTTTSEGVRLPETTTQTLFVNNHPIRFSRSNQINRHFYNPNYPRIPLRFVLRHPCRNYFHINNNNNENNKLSVAAVESDRTNPSGNDVVFPSKWLEFKHEYGHHHEAELFQPKYEIDGDKLQMHHHHHHHQHKGIGFMRAIRKFLKHAFD